MSLLIIGGLSAFKSHSQDSGSQSMNGLNSPVHYKASDSIVADIPGQIVRLYGDAQVDYEDITLNAELIEIDMEKNEV